MHMGTVNIHTVHPNKVKLVPNVDVFLQRIFDIILISTYFHKMNEACIEKVPLIV